MPNHVICFKGDLPQYYYDLLAERQEIERQFIKKKIHDRMRIYGESFEKALNAVESVTIGNGALFQTLREKGNLKP